MSTVIYGILEEEKERNLEMQEMHQKEIDSLPKGTLVPKKIKGHIYQYLYYWDGEKTRCKYIGKNKELIAETHKKIAKRKHHEGIVKRLKLEYKQICKIVKE